MKLAFRVKESKFEKIKKKE